MRLRIIRTARACLPESLCLEGALSRSVSHPDSGLSANSPRSCSWATSCRGSVDVCVHPHPAQLPYAASLLVSVGLLLAGWSVFVRLNRYAEELEPEAMAAAKGKDHKLK